MPDLEPGALPWNGHGGVVIPVRRRHGDESPGNGRHGSAAVLKVAFPHEEATRERHALALWGGHGAVRLLAADAGSCALLLERLDAGRSLQDVPLETAVPVWGGLVRQLSVVPDDRPEWQEIDHVAARAEQWSDEFPETWEHLARPFPRWLLEAALEVCQTRGAVGRRSGKDVLVHADLHYLNILARPGVPGTRCATRAGGARRGRHPSLPLIPQPMIGEAEFAVAPVLWNRLRELPQQGSRAGAARALPGFQLRQPVSTPRPPGSGAWRARWRTPSGMPRSAITKAIWPVRCGWRARWRAGPCRTCRGRTSCPSRARARPNRPADQR